MGVKTLITLSDLPETLEVKTLIASTNGVMDSVYFLDDDRIVKIFENADAEAVEEELKLLAHCQSLSVSKPEGEMLWVQDKPALIYRRCRGESLKCVGVDEIKQIGAFLRSFHRKTVARQSTNERLFEKPRLEQMIRKSDMEIFDKMYKKIALTLRDDGVIHGDLFLDNALFENGELSCVIDFSQACNGDFLFDLAVTDLSWCDSDEKTEALLEGYGATLTLDEFRPYRDYATLFYSVNRYHNGGNYQELLEKLV